MPKASRAVVADAKIEIIEKGVAPKIAWEVNKGQNLIGHIVRIRDYGCFWAMPVEGVIEEFPSLELAKLFFTRGK